VVGFGIDEALALVSASKHDAGAEAGGRRRLGRGTQRARGIAMTRRNGFLLRGSLVWLLMPVAAIANGAFRDLLLAPLLGARAAEIVSALVLLAFIYVVTAAFLSWTGSGRRPKDLWALGLLWMVLTIAFEFAFFGLLMEVPLSRLVAAYNVFNGELWPLVVAGVLLAPPVVNACLRLVRPEG
jgi:hypothetical protein